MIYVAYFILAFLFLQLLVAVANVIFREKLKPQNNDVSDITLSVLIPARNEEQNIGNILSDLYQMHNNVTEILVYNDHSSDKTAEIIAEFMKKDTRIKLISLEDLPDDWLGKNFACHKLSLHATGNYFLFVDADIRVKNDLIMRTLQYVKNKNVDLLSIFPLQEMYTFAEKITVPNMHYILLSLLPLPLVRLAKVFPSLSASNGQFMLIKSDVYREFLPHFTFKNSRAEDIEIALFLKRKRKKVSCVTGISDISCRMYHNLNEALAGFSKNVTYFFGNSYVVSMFFWLVTTLGFIPLGFVFGWQAVILFFAVQFLIRIFISINAKQNIFENVIFMFFQQCMLGAFIFKSLQNKITNNLEWKGRKI